MLKAKSTAAANGDHVGVVRYGLQSLYFLLWVCFPCSLLDMSFTCNYIFSKPGFQASVCMW